MSNAVTYTPTEQKDIYNILHSLFQNPETRSGQLSELERIGGGSVLFLFSLTVPKVCGDGKRRYSPAEYLDYLFQTPTLDVMLDDASAADPTYIYSYNLEPNGNFTASVKTKQLKSP